MTEGVDPGRDEWNAWTSFRNDIAKEWNPDNLKAVAFVLNRVSSILGKKNSPPCCTCRRQQDSVDH